jgi:hypothetical protein
MDDPDCPIGWCLIALEPLRALLPVYQLKLPSIGTDIQRKFARDDRSSAKYG